MFMRSLLRAAAYGARASGPMRAAVPAPTAGKAQCIDSIRVVEGRRYIAMYGYTQAKALVYSKYGEPKDVIRYVG